METLEELTFRGFEEALVFCLRVCPASRPPWPGSGEGRAMSVGSGRQLSMLLDQCSPLGVFSKILLESSAWGNSEEFCYVWEILDTRYGCSAFRLTPLGRSTEGNGSLLWQTPVADDSINRQNG